MSPRTVTIGLAALLAAVSPLSAQVTARAPTPLPPLVLEDQFDRMHRVNDWRGRIVVLVFGDRKSAEANRALGEALHVAFHPSAKGRPPAEAAKAPVRPLDGLPPGTPSPDVATVPIAAVGKVPAVVGGLIKRQIRGGSPEVPVLIDFEDQMKGSFGLAAGVPNVVVVDAAGRVRATAVGPLSAEQFGQLTALIEALRCEAVAPPQ